MNNDFLDRISQISQIINSPAQQMLEKMQMYESNLTLNETLRKIQLPSDAAGTTAQDSTRYLGISGANQIKSLVKQVSIVSDPITHSFDSLYSKIRNLQEAVLDVLPPDHQDELQQEIKVTPSERMVPKPNIQQTLQWLINVLLPLAISIYMGYQTAAQPERERHHREMMQQNEEHKLQNTEAMLRLESAIMDMLVSLANLAPEQLHALEDDPSHLADDE